MKTAVVPSPEHVERVLSVLIQCRPSPGQSPVEIIGGPFDGATVWLNASEVIALAREKMALSLEVEPTGRLVAVHRLQTRTGAVRDGFRGFYVQNSVFDLEKMEMDDLSECDPDL